jgi:hypothetical protein
MNEENGMDCIVRFHDVRRQGELQRCLFSLLGQSYRPLHIILVTQRFSIDEIAATNTAIAPLFALADAPRLSLLNWEEPDPIDARTELLNLGLRAVEGRYLGFLDYDDVLYPEAYELLTSRLEASGAAIAFASVRIVKLVVHDRFFEADSIVIPEFGGSGLRDLFCRNFCPIHSYVIDRRRLPATILFFDSLLKQEEDYDLLLRICAGYPSDFSLLATQIGDYFYKTDGSNTVPTPWSPHDDQQLAAFEAVKTRIEHRRQTTLIVPVVQVKLGLDPSNETTTIRDALSRSR